MVLVAYLSIVAQKVIPVGPYFIRSNGDVDAYYVGELGVWFFILIGLLYALYLVYLTSKKKRAASISILVVMVAYFVFGWPSYHGQLKSEQTYPWLSRELAGLLRSTMTEEQLAEEITLYVPASLDNKREAELYNGLRVRAIDNTHILSFNEKNLLEMPTSTGFIIREYGLLRCGDGFGESPIPVQ